MFLGDSKKYFYNPKSMSSRGEIFMRWNVDMESIIDLGSLTKRGLSKAALDIKIVPGSSET